MDKEIDLLAIQMEAEAIARSEYLEAFKRLDSLKDSLNERQKKWLTIQSRLQAAPLIAPNGQVVSEESLDSLIEKILHAVTEYEKLQKLFANINGNELLKSQWDRLLMSIKLTGGDSND